MPERSLIQVVYEAQRPDIHMGVHRLYQELSTEIDREKPRCVASGRCCKFESYDHRLYVTTAELATFLTDQVGMEHINAKWSLPVLRDMDGCPYQVDGLCGVHLIRPFGCRIYFCDIAKQSWMTDAYERYHAKLRELHGLWGVEYRYVEWRQALMELKIPIE